MISYEAFAKLKRGDVVLFNGSPRVVQIGPADLIKPPQRRPGRGYSEAKWKRRRMHVTFAIKRRSWRDAGYTVYQFNDVKRVLSLPRRPLSTAVVTRQELRHLIDLGFDPREEFEKAKEVEVRMHQKGYQRLKSRCVALNPPERKP